MQDMQCCANRNVCNEDIDYRLQYNTPALEKYKIA